MALSLNPARTVLPKQTNLSLVSWNCAWVRLCHFICWLYRDFGDAVVRVCGVMSHGSIKYVSVFTCTMFALFFLFVCFFSKMQSVQDVWMQLFGLELNIIMGSCVSKARIKCQEISGRLNAEPWLRRQMLCALKGCCRSNFPDLRALFSGAPFMFFPSDVTADHSPRLSASESWNISHHGKATNWLFEQWRSCLQHIMNGLMQRAKDTKAFRLLVLGEGGSSREQCLICPVFLSSYLF